MRRDAEARDRELVRAYLADELAPEVRRATEERLLRRSALGCRCLWPRAPGDGGAALHF
jgi:hypothetical protein